MGFIRRIKEVVGNAIAMAKGRARPHFDPAWLGSIGPFRQHHPVFYEFMPFEGSVPVDLDVDYIGMRTRPDFLPAFISRSTLSIACSIPAVNEEYFEWIDLLLSVREAREKYTMIELGAGYGRWAVRAALAARKKGIQKIRIGLAEAEPAHVSFLKSHLLDNNIRPEEVMVHECAVSDEIGSVEFYIGSPDDFSTENTPRTWYGQSISKDYEQAADLPVVTASTYHGRPVLTYASGWKAIIVEKTNIRTILCQYGDIDLLDLDVQGEELKILTASADLLDCQVKRLHIGTHGPELEEGLRKLLRRRGWLLVRDYGCHKVNPTPFGEVQFVDGVQSWINPRFDVSVS